MGSYVEQLEAPEEVDQARLSCLQSWTEKRLDTVVVSVLGKDQDGYRLLCELPASLSESPVGNVCSLKPFSFVLFVVSRWLRPVAGRQLGPPQAAAV